MARHNEIGKLGEDIACEFLEGKGWSILARNVKKPYGEIDIVLKDRKGKLRFIEVKSVSRETGRAGSSGYRPEENVHPQKIRRLRRIIEVYLSSHNVGEWQFDIVTVSIDVVTETAQVKHLENIILGS